MVSNWKVVPLHIVNSPAWPGGKGRVGAGQGHAVGWGGVATQRGACAAAASCGWLMQLCNGGRRSHEQWKANHAGGSPTRGPAPTCVPVRQRRPSGVHSATLMLLRVCRRRGMGWGGAAAGSAATRCHCGSHQCQTAMHAMCASGHHCTTQQGPPSPSLPYWAPAPQISWRMCWRAGARTPPAAAAAARRPPRAAAPARRRGSG